MGRPPKLTPHQRREAIKRRDRGGESLADIGRSYNVSGGLWCAIHGPAGAPALANWRNIL
jgi:hypothetical protein